MTAANIKLPKGTYGNILVQPRGWARSVIVSEKAFLQLCKAQEQMGPDTLLVLTRGFEAQTLFKKIMRAIGGIIFCLLYPARRHERAEIFKPNGHNIDGNHIDVGIMHKKRKLNFLPFSVFTPPRFINDNNKELILNVHNSLNAAGFNIHTNRIESLQIHCDLRTVSSPTTL
jgi:hypothetical protein